MAYKITQKEVLLALFIGALGYFFSSKNTLLSLNNFTPLKLLLVSYGVLFVSLLYLAKHGIIIYHLEIKHPMQVIGTILIWFSFFLVLSMSNPFVQYTTTNSFDGASNLFYGTEDAVTWSFWTQHIEPTPENIPRLRLLTFVFTPMVLTLLGSLLITGKIHY